MLRRKGPVIKSVESVLRLKESLWWERFVEEVGLEPEVREGLHMVTSGYATWFTAGVQSASLIMTSLMTS